MVDARHWRLKTFLVVAFALAAVHCSKQNAPVTQDGSHASAQAGTAGPHEALDGTQSTGGGFARVSTPEQVNAALDKALELATISDPNKNVIVQFWRYWGKGSERDYIKNPVRLFPKLDPANVGDPNSHVKDAGAFESPYLQALKRNRVIRLESGDCLKSTTLKRHTDASVSEFTANAEICFSIGNLTRIPPSTLLREVLSLVLHEVSHLGGAPETEAIGWQDEFAAYFGARFGELETDALSKMTPKRLEDAKVLLSTAQVMAGANPENTSIFETMGQFNQVLRTLPYFRDALALELKLKPQHPELIANYSNSVLALIQKVSIKFKVRSDTLKMKGMRIPLEFMPSDKVVPTLIEVRRDLDQIENNFSAIFGGAGAAQSACDLPDGVGDLNLFPVDPPGTVKPNGIQPKCRLPSL